MATILSQPLCIKGKFSGQGRWTVGWLVGWLNRFIYRANIAWAPKLDELFLTWRFYEDCMVSLPCDKILHGSIVWTSLAGCHTGVHIEASPTGGGQAEETFGVTLEAWTKWYIFKCVEIFRCVSFCGNVSILFQDIMIIVCERLIDKLSLVEVMVWWWVGAKPSTSHKPLAFVRGIHWWIPPQRANNVENVSIFLCYHAIAIATSHNLVSDGRVCTHIHASSGLNELISTQTTSARYKGTLIHWKDTPGA